MCGRLAGKGALSGEITERLLPTLTQSFALTASVIFLAFLVVFRSPTALLITMIPSLFAILSVFILMRAASCDHLEQVNKSDIRALGKSETVATLLPGCDFHLGLKKYAPARALIEAKAIVALATDYNPGTSPTVSMPMILSLACTQLRMTPAEAITAATINAAYALRREKSIGSLEVGKQADIAVFEVADYREIPYYFGVNVCWMTVKLGRVIHAAEQTSI